MKLFTLQNILVDFDSYVIVQQNQAQLKPYFTHCRTNPHTLDD